jgi:hypothetical protein
MTIVETERIDIVASRPDSNVVKLVVADHLPWDDVEQHSRILQDKINTYIAFVESGQLLRLKEPKIPASPDVRILLAALHPPNEAGKEFLGRVKEFLGGIGIGFELEVRGDATP